MSFEKDYERLYKSWGDNPVKEGTTYRDICRTFGKELTQAHKQRVKEVIKGIVCEDLPLRECSVRNLSLPSTAYCCACKIKKELKKEMGITEECERKMELIIQKTNEKDDIVIPLDDDVQAITINDGKAIWTPYVKENNKERD